MTSFIRTTLLLLVFSAAVPGLAQEQASEIDRLMKSYFEYGQFHGSVLVADGGRVLYENGFGMANYEWEEPNTPETRFRVGSITKQFTSALILRLREAGEIDLDGKLGDYLPYYRQNTGQKVTVRQLLRHTSGIPSYTNQPGFRQNVSRNPFETQRFVEEHCSGDPTFEPGSQFSYSNSGYFLLGAIIEQITGKSYAQALQEEIFEPIGMKNSGYDDHETIVPQRAAGYSRRGDGYVNASYLDMSIPFAAGSLYSTVRDLYLWDRALASDAILSEESKELMLTPGLGDYGFGFGIRELKVGDTDETIRVIAHSGGINGFNTIIVRLPERDGLVVLLGNVEGIQRLREIQQGVINILHQQPWSEPRRAGVDEILKVLDKTGIDAAVARYREIKDVEPDNYEFDERQLNGLGYRELGAGRVKEAIGLFLLNVEEHPESFNVYDSLGEAYLADGNEELALHNYRKSVELEPQNSNGVEAITRLTVGPTNAEGVAEDPGEEPETPAVVEEAEDRLAASILGSWSGQGTYDGNHLSLSRSWTQELDGQVLQADMQVTMSNGTEFTSRTYWHRVDPLHYEVVWMDEMGRFDTVIAEAGSESDAFTITHRDELAADGSSRQRWEFEVPNEGRYVERLYSQDETGNWTQVGEFRFSRVDAARD